MPPVHRCNGGRSITVPTEFIEAVDSLFAVNDGCADEFGMDDRECDALASLCEQASWDLAEVDLAAEVLSAARNVLDDWVMCDECERPQAAPLDPIGESCQFCMWCQALILRDWADWLFDRAGFPRPPYLEESPADYDPAAHYRRLWEVAGAS